MNCEKYLFLIDDLIEDELDAPSAEQTEAHVFGCGDCRAHYESLKREKEIYAHFLFDVEPSIDLFENFQTRRAAEKRKNFIAEMPHEAIKKSGFFDFLRFSPAFAAAAILLVFGIGFAWLKFAPDKNGADQFAAAPNTDLSPASPPIGANEKNEKASARTENETGENKNGENKNQIKISKSASKVEAVKVHRAAFSAAQKPFAVQAVKIKQKPISEQSKQNSLTAKLPDETERQKTLVTNLEKEIAGQIEKIELLLRSFRNAREIQNAENAENIETYDVQYEKRQARALLEKNARLRIDAENFGVFYAEELLSRAEPYLLDIANLENNPGRERVLDIKERVKNQSIIASLQIY